MKAGPSDTLDLETLHAIERRVLWLAVRMVHEANNVPPHRDGLKVGGHQASSASVVSILTALYFSWLRAEDHVSIKPHASRPTMRSSTCSAGWTGHGAVVPLGVADFGQSGELQDLYPKMGIDQDSIFEAALLALGLSSH